MGEMIKQVSAYVLAVIVIYIGYWVYNKNPDISMALIGIGILAACIVIIYETERKNLLTENNNK
jgi:hypothetical protein